MSAQPLLKASPCQTQIELGFACETAVLDACGALYLPRHALLVVSDLHLEKGSYFAARGNPLPCWDTRDTLMRLAEAVSYYRPRTVVCLGDSFHDVRAGERISAPDAELLEQIMRSVKDWIWVTGNHDPEIAARFAGQVTSTCSVGPIVLCHKPEEGAPPLIAGHYHPKHRVRMAERSISAPCFVIGEHLILMPAFGAYTGGLRTLSEPIAALFADRPRRYVLSYAAKLWAVA
jgi:DNA ligase-associated metallophosphoesterase